MRRTNTIVLVPTSKQSPHLHTIADACACLWNEINYVIQRVKEVAEEFNITFELIDECGTSSTCPRCGSNQITPRGRLFKCQGCKLEVNRDGVGAVNIGLAHGAAFPGEVINRAVACPLEVRI